MTRVLLVGYDPSTVDYSDPALPPSMTAEKIHAGIAHVMGQMRDRGWEADDCFILPDDTAVPTIARKLAAATYDCVVIGAGVRLPPKHLAIFDQWLMPCTRVRRARPSRSTRLQWIAQRQRPDGCHGKLSHPDRDA